MSPPPYTTILLHPLRTASTPSSHFCVILTQPDIFLVRKGLFTEDEDELDNEANLVFDAGECDCFIDLDDEGIALIQCERAII